ncbi:MAG: bifunctional 23S rRNA (guanine(2069)-N(7))-methyltransferase RlmK/23S rRNA (guanine(2445)-N(2))-methyltransferase RlmL [Candidatus Latescibacterota bacterium]|nr:bifunctional 23S rRNA (guanine(2069)-N(7))-methyltransferase RlmK/23S rRNA (guanine(2445)-N(2))-methyltransferase RlmL [Candidatus Latescibacterota bacterium]
MSAAVHRYFAPVPRGIAPLLVDELTTLGIQSPRDRRSGVSFTGSLEIGYRVCLWSRLASRVLLVLDELVAEDADTLYEGIRKLPWQDHMSAEGTMAVTFNGSSDAIRNTHFGALRVKDAVVDYLRDATGRRPGVDLENPSLRINVHLRADRAAVSIDLSGQSLHRRGYRIMPVEAPLKENLAAATLIRAGWPDVAAAGGGLADLMCGSGTLLIEAAWIATDRAPGWKRSNLGLLRWRGHDAPLWSRLCEEADERHRSGLTRLPEIQGYDADTTAVRAARTNLRAIGLGGRITVDRRTLSEHGAASSPPGLVVANLPYGHRLAQESDVRGLFLELGDMLTRSYPGWRVGLLTTNPEWAGPLGLESGLRDRFLNGALECHLIHGEIAQVGAATVTPSAKDQKRAVAEGGEMFANRLRKNLRSVGKWARRQQVSCYRLYDADMPEYALAVDLYQGEQLYAHVQEYRPPTSVDPARAATRLQAALSRVSEVLEIPKDRMFFKLRERKRGKAQYGRLGHGGSFHEVREGPCRFLVNFHDYLDTGLFLDHRLTREMISDLAGGKRFLNLFGYTATATVHAAAGGAESTTTVDISQTYLDWGRRNLERNGFADGRHRLQRADCIRWLRERRRERYDLILLDPPTFSNSKRMEDNFDVQRNHVELIRNAVALLDGGGLLLFSTNFRRFRMDTEALRGLYCEDVTAKTIPQDFQRNPRIHQCWRIRTDR